MTAGAAEGGVMPETSLLIIVIDTNPFQRFIQEKPRLLIHCLDSVIAFANSHLMQKAQNKLAILGCHQHKSEYLYPSPGKPLDVRQIDGQYEMFTLVEKTVKQRLGDFLRSGDDAPEGFTSESLLAGTIAMALCYISRVRIFSAPSSITEQTTRCIVPIREATSANNIKRQCPPGVKMNSRILVITGSGDTAAQYINYMNVFFTAQKQQVLIDVCSLDKHLSLLQQGCDITGGLYLKVPSLDGLLQYLLWVFLPEGPVRKKLVLPPAGRVDYRAACFCHRELITIGFVCSVCLSVFCKFSPICTTCHTVFKFAGPLPIKPKKKKLKV